MLLLLLSPSSHVPRCKRFTLRGSDCHPAGSAGNDIDAELFYDATRCLAVPGVSVRFGWRLVTTLSAGIGYRLERQSDRELASTTGVLIERQETENVHQLVARFRAGLEYRLTDWFTAGLTVAATPALAGGDVELDLAVAGVVGVYLYP